MVLRRALQSAKQRQIVGEPAHQRQLHHQRPLAGIVAMVAPGDQVVFQAAFALHAGHRSIRLGEAADFAIRLFDGNLKIAAAGGGIKIVNHERAGGDVGLIQHVAILPNRDLGVGSGNPADGRGKTFLRVREHRIAGGEGYSLKLYRVKHIARREGISEGQFTLPARQVALKPGAAGHPLGLIIAVGGQAIAGVQAPGADVHAAFQHQIVIALGAALAGTLAGA